MRIRFRRTTLKGVISALFLAVGFSFGQDKQTEGINLVRRAVELTDLRLAPPYHRRNSLGLQDPMSGLHEGKEDIFFVSPQRWRRELRFQDYYDESAVFLDGKMYRVRSRNYTPPAARKDVAGSLRNLPAALDYKVLRIYTRNVNSTDARCVYLQQKAKDRPDEITWCFDPTSGLPVVEIYKDYSWRVEFSSYKPFGKQFVPGTVEYFVGNKSRDKAVTTTIEAVGPEIEQLFKPQTGAEVRNWCDDMQSPIAVSADRPDIPPGARSHSGLELVYEVTTDEKGNVANVVPMSPKPFADRIVMQTLAGWKFKPARCGATPAVTDFVVNFQQ